MNAQNINDKRLETRSRSRNWKSELDDFWWAYSENRPAVLGLVFICLILLVAIAAPLLAPFSPTRTLVGGYLESPNANHPFGTDDLGRDTLSGVVYGTRVSLLVGLVSAAISTLIGILIGAIAGFFGGITDNLLMRITDLFMMIPRFLLAILIVAFFGSGIWLIILALSVLGWPTTARLVRAEYMSLREQEFVEAARVVGMRNRKIIFSEILPNAMFAVVVNASLQVALAIKQEAALSYLGLGDPNLISWGLMLYNAQAFMRQAWWVALFPGMAIFLTCVALNLVGDGLNDALNPRIRKR